MIYYYSEEKREDVIELSDLRILWHVETSEGTWHFACEEKRAEFEEIYNTNLYFFGRSGRHICVDDTPENRKRVVNMTRTIRRMQNELMAKYGHGAKVINDRFVQYPKPGRIARS